MIKNILIGNDELNIALAEFSEDPSEEKYFAVLAVLAGAYDIGDRFFVAFEGDVFQSVREENDDYLVVFSDMDSAEIGPDTDLAVLDLEEIIGNILSDDEISGFVIDPFSYAVFVDRDACAVIRSTALAGPEIDVRMDLSGMTCEEMLRIAEDIDDGKGEFVKDSIRAEAIYESILEKLYIDIAEGIKDEKTDELMAEAEMRLAKLILNGETLDNDEEAAKEMLADSCDKLNTEAMILLGSLEERNGNMIGAAAMYHKSAIMGNSRGLLEFGRMLMNGQGVDKDMAFARECFIKAAENGVGDAYYYLGQIAEKGLSGDPDPGKAKEYYDLGTGLGSIRCREISEDIPGCVFPDRWGRDAEDEKSEKSYVFDFSRSNGNMRS